MNGHGVGLGKGAVDEAHGLVDVGVVVLDPVYDFCEAQNLAD